MLLLSTSATAELSGRIKGFGVATALPEHDLVRHLDGTPRYSSSGDLRLLWRAGRGKWHIGIDHETMLAAGDDLSIENFGGQPLEQNVADDAARIVEASWTLDNGARHRLTHRFDRFWVRFQQEKYSLTLGRQALSWGGGLVFQPLDLFNPFAPAVVDRDYKAGDDLMLFEALLPGGQDLQMLAVGRRDERNNISGDHSSFAAKWHGFASVYELEVIAAQHFDEATIGLALRRPVGGALLRTDILIADSQTDGWTFSVLANIDYSLTLWDKALYVFAEAFYNGFGVNQLPDQLSELPLALQQRQQRGEVFALMRRYIAAGTTIDWHPLWKQNLTLIGNLHDASMLLTVSLTHDLAQTQSLEMGMVAAIGQRGDEYGGVPVSRNPFNGETLTSGGGLRMFLRWVRYF